MTRIIHFEKNKYYRHQEQNFIFKFIEIHEQDNYAVALIEITDWIGSTSSQNYYLNNGNRLLMFNYHDMKNCYELDDEQIAEFEVDAILKMIDLMKSSDVFMLPLKKTEFRMQLSKKISGLIHD